MSGFAIYIGTNLNGEVNRAAGGGIVRTETGAHAGGLGRKIAVGDYPEGTGFSEDGLYGEHGGSKDKTGGNPSPRSAAISSG